MLFSISQHFNPRFNALGQIGSNEYALVRQYDEHEWYKMPHIAETEKTKTAAQSFSTLKTDTRQHRCTAFFFVCFFTVYVQGLFVF